MLISDSRKCLIYSRLALRDAAHRLKSSSAMLGPHPLAAIAKEVESVWRTNHAEPLARLIAQLETEYAQVCDTLHRELTTPTTEAA